VIIFDEATSALNSATESKILDSIADLDTSLTLFIFAHGSATLKGCTEIIEIENGWARHVNWTEITCLMDSNQFRFYMLFPPEHSLV